MGSHGSLESTNGTTPVVQICNRKPEIVWAIARNYGAPATTTSMSVEVSSKPSDAVARTFEEGPAAREPYVLSPDHSLLLTGGVDGAVHIWDVAAGCLMHTLTGHKEDVLSASFDAENSTVVTSDWGGGIRAWNPTTGAPLASCHPRPPARTR